MIIRLIKEMANGTVRFWSAQIALKKGNTAEITTSYGFVGNEENAITNTKSVETGKNIGKINELSGANVAMIDTLKSINTKIKSGYEVDEETAEEFEKLESDVVSIFTAIEEAKKERDYERESAREEKRKEKEAIAARNAEDDEDEEDAEDDEDEEDEEDEEESDCEDAEETLDENDEMDDDNIDA